MDTFPFFDLDLTDVIDTGWFVDSVVLERSVELISLIDTAGVGLERRTVNQLIVHLVRKRERERERETSNSPEYPLIDRDRS